MLSNVELGIFAVLFLWMVLLSFLVWRTLSHYNSFTKGVTNKSLSSVLEEMLKSMKVAQKDIDYLSSRCDTIEKQAVFHIQKIGLLRFNPFKDTGGDQSFILALVDGNDTGVVISGLHSRSGTRWYAKNIVNGKGLEHELSEEERKALKEAKTTGNYGKE